MFCHEGPWHKVDRIWTIRTDGSGLRKIHTRTMDMEIAGHEFFSPDGKIIWYDLQTPKSKVFWLAGHELATGKLIKYSVAREHWSVHFNVSPDGGISPATAVVRAASLRPETVNGFISSLRRTAGLKPKNWLIFPNTITNSNRTSPSRWTGNGSSFAPTCMVRLTFTRSR